jgi:hypothetical protein
MVLEYAQLLSTAQHLHGEANALLYKPTHKNHPSAVWTRMSQANYEWLYNTFMWTGAEYEYRFKRVHKSVITLGRLLSNPPSGLIGVGSLTPPLRAMPNECKIGDPLSWADVVLSYRTYYTTHKRDLFKWTGRTKPQWS